VNVDDIRYWTPTKFSDLVGAANKRAVAPLQAAARRRETGAFLLLGPYGACKSRVAELVTRKGDRLQALLAAGSVLFPGAVEFIREAADAVPIAIASGALRHEIEEILHAAGIAPLFRTIVASGDTLESKPSPAPYQLAFEHLRAETGEALDPRRIVAIEDSRWGLESARGAGLRCVAVTNSYPADELTGAELVVSGLKDLTLDALDRLCAGARRT
jgi:HAD superfamily hydrolase (TIGR01509 family)